MKKALRYALIASVILVSVLIFFGCGEDEACTHDIVTVDAKAPSCTEAGYSAYEYCTKCDYATETVTKAALGHDMKDADNKQPTCTEIGWYPHKYCARCDYVENKVERAALGHSLTSVEGYAPSCTATGWEPYERCLRCDYSTMVVIPALGHDVVSVEGKAPTCSSAGWTAYEYCTRMDYTTKEVLPRLVHDAELTVGKPSSCTVAGTSVAIKCSTCKAQLVEATPLPLLEHDFSNGTSCKNCLKLYSDRTIEEKFVLSLSSDGEYYVVEGLTDTQDTVVVIPSVYMNKPVREIKSGAFAGNVNIHELTIPDSIVKINSDAFDGLTALEKIYYNAKDVEAVKNNTFNLAGTESSGITVYVGESVEKIPSRLFSTSDGRNAPNVVNIDFTEATSLRSIGSGAFQFTKIKEITVPSTVTELGDAIFSNCSLLETVYYNAQSPAMIDGICKTFTACGTSEGMTVYISEGVTELPRYTFYNAKIKAIVFEGTPTLETVGEKCFSSVKVLQSISLPETVREIGEKAFESSSLVSITLPEGVETVGEYAFASCSSLTALNIPSTVESISSTVIYNSPLTSSFTELGGGRYLGGTVNPYLVLVGPDAAASAELSVNSGTKFILSSAFKNSTALTSVAIPDSVKVIEAETFYGCTALNSVSLGSGVENIKSNAFYGCTALNSVSLGSGVKNIEDNAFRGCTLLEEISLPSGLESIGEYAFYGCAALKEINIPSSVRSMGQRAFENCTSLASVSGMGGLSKIERYTFSYCTSMSTLSIADGPVEISERAFENCTSLVSVNIPASVSKVRFSAFGNCKELKTVTGMAGVKQIESNCFYGCLKLASVEIGSVIEKVGGDAFGACPALIGTGSGARYIGNAQNPKVILLKYSGSATSFDIDENVRIIYSGAFMDNSSLATLTGGEGLVAIGAYAFKNCKALTAITIHENVKYIGSEAFYYCWNVRTFNYNATSIADYDVTKYAFGLVGAMSGGITANIGENVTRIPSYLFSNTAVTALNFKNPDRGIEIGAYAFYEATLIKTLSLSNVTGIGMGAFSGCTALTSVSGISSFTSIPESLFDGCKSLVSADILESATEIGNYALRNCESLVSFEFPESITTIPRGCLEGCKSLTEITLPRGITHVESSAFRDCSGVTRFNYLAESASFYSDGAQFAGLGKSGATVTLFIGKHVRWLPYDLGEGSRITRVVFEEGSALELIPPLSLKSLVEIELPSSIKVIGESAFEDCSSLVSIVIPEGTEMIGSGAFKACKALTSVTLPTTLTSLSRYAFSNCTSLAYSVYEGGKYLGTEDNPHYYLIGPSTSGTQSVTLHSDTVAIAESAFKNNSYLKTVKLNEGLKQIQQNAFRECTSLTEIECPSTLQLIGDSAFSYCSALTTAYVAGNVGNYAFDSCVRLTTLTFSPSVKIIGCGAFRGDRAIVTLNIPDTVEEIGEYAFHFAGIKNLTLGRGIKKIGYEAFSGQGIANLVYNTVAAEDLLPDSDVFLSALASDAKLTFGKDVKRIPANLFKYSNGRSAPIKQIEFEAGFSLDEQGEDCFGNLTVLESVYINDLASFAKSNFTDSPLAYTKNVYIDGEAVTELVLDGDVTEVGNGTFSGCTVFTKVTIGDGVTKIGEGAFRGCTALASVEGMRGLSYISLYAFAETGLVSVALPEGIFYISAGAFADCDSLTAVELPSTVLLVEEGAYKGSDNLQK